MTENSSEQRDAELETCLDRLTREAHVPSMNRIRDLFAQLQLEAARCRAGWKAAEQERDKWRIQAKAYMTAAEERDDLQAALQARGLTVEGAIAHKLRAGGQLEDYGDEQ